MVMITELVRLAGPCAWDSSLGSEGQSVGGRWGCDGQFYARLRWPAEVVLSMS